jgi:hypothetical protein
MKSECISVTKRSLMAILKIGVKKEKQDIKTTAGLCYNVQG